MARPNSDRFIHIQDTQRYYISPPVHVQPVVFSAIHQVAPLLSAAATQSRDGLCDYSYYSLAYTRPPISHDVET